MQRVHPVHLQGLEAYCKMSRIFDNPWHRGPLAHLINLVALNKLVIDIGNTLCKAAVFQEGRLQKLWVNKEFGAVELDDLLREYPVDKAIVSTVRRDDCTVELTSSRGINTLLAGPHLGHPLKMGYRSPETLGTDRLAAAVAGFHLFPGNNVLVINAGTCLTTDLVSEAGEYLGGTISPGLHMRLKSLHHFTGKLPLVDPVIMTTAPAGGGTAGDERRQKQPGEAPRKRTEETSAPGIPGQTTREAIRAGVICGMLAEIDGLIDRYRGKIRLFNVILSGGDIKVFDKKLKNRIFAVENIVLHGLNQMLEYNA